MSFIIARCGRSVNVHPVHFMLGARASTQGMVANKKQEELILSWARNASVIQDSKGNQSLSGIITQAKRQARMVSQNRGQIFQSWDLVTLRVMMGSRNHAKFGRWWPLLSSCDSNEILQAKRRSAQLTRLERLDRSQQASYDI